MSIATSVAIARSRRGMSSKQLAEAAGLTPVTISKIEHGHIPGEQTIFKLAKTLDYPVEFFTQLETNAVDQATVSFRSLKKMSAKERDKALSAASLGLLIYAWLDEEFDLPGTDLPDLSHESIKPAVAARLVRVHWGIGERPIADVLKLLESKGIRVLSLSEEGKNVDAYSFWKSGRPYIFLNQMKSAERSIFDCAHELGHLVLHHHAGPESKRDAEAEADAFASSFLMPSGDVLSQIPKGASLGTILSKKSRWKVSAMALTKRLNSLGVISDWAYRTYCIELSKMGYRSREPGGVERETSAIWEKVLRSLWSEGRQRSYIAESIPIPEDELNSLTFGLLNEGKGLLDIRGKRSLRVVGG